MGELDFAALLESEGEKTQGTSIVMKRVVNDMMIRVVVVNGEADMFETPFEAYEYVADLLDEADGYTPVIESGSVKDLLLYSPQVHRHFDYLQNIVRPFAYNQMPYYATELRDVDAAVRFHDGYDVVIFRSDKKEEIEDILDNFIAAVEEWQEDGENKYIGAVTREQTMNSYGEILRFEHAYEITLQMVEMSGGWYLEIETKISDITNGDTDMFPALDAVAFYFPDFTEPAVHLLEFLHHARINVSRFS